MFSFNRQCVSRRSARRPCSEVSEDVYINTLLLTLGLSIIISSRTSKKPTSHSNVKSLTFSNPKSKEQNHLPATTMQYLAILSILSVGAFAAAIAEPNAEANAAADSQLLKRANCGNILPSCVGGHVAGGANCLCKGQQGPCDLWLCPDGSGAEQGVCIT